MLDAQHTCLFPPDYRGKGMTKGQPIVRGVYHAYRLYPDTNQAFLQVSSVVHVPVL